MKPHIELTPFPYTVDYVVLLWQRAAKEAFDKANSSLIPHVC